MAPLEPYEKVYVDSDFLDEDEDVHGQISCESCHGGNPDAETMEEAHKGIAKDPTFPDATRSCGDCHLDGGHPEIAGKNGTNLHISLSPFKNKIALRANPDATVRDTIEGAMGTHCMTCHSSCGQCHVSRPASVEGGLIEGHLFKKTPPVETNCTSCHGSRVGNEFLGQNEGIPADVHHTKGMKCKECHTGDQMHGSGHDHFDRYEITNRAKCEDCHTSSAAGKDKCKATSLEHPSHIIHKDKVSCQVCHSLSYKNCYNCHVGKDTSGAPYFKTDPSKMDFKIGLSSKVSEERPERYVVVRHVPVSGKLFDFYVKDALTNLGNAPTWKFATPHTIQIKTPQNESCLSCHGNNDLFLTEADATAWEVEANKAVFVPLKPPPHVRHSWLEQPKLHLKKVECLTCHDPSRAAPVKDCTECHGAKNILTTKEEGTPGGSLLSWRFTNQELIDKGLYVVGSNTIPGLDLAGILIILLTFAGCTVHGILRFLGRKRK